MKKAKAIKIIIAVLVCTLLISVVSIYSIPKLRVSLFVHTYHEWIEESVSAGNGVPADNAVFLGYNSVNTWESDHSMIEFIILSFGDIYYGCYYSPDDVPLAFQNTDIELTQNGHNYWEWHSEGDNHGSTSRIIKNWYFFKASF